MDFRSFRIKINSDLITLFHPELSTPTCAVDVIRRIKNPAAHLSPSQGNDSPSDGTRVPQTGIYKSMSFQAIPQRSLFWVSSSWASGASEASVRLGSAQ